MSATATAHGRRHAIAPKQIKAIHAAVKAQGIDDTTYRLRLKTYGALTCKDLTWQQATELLDSLNGKAPSAGRNKLPYEDLDGRPGFASGSQCRLVAAMFSQVTRVAAVDKEGRDKALNSFCNRILGVAALRMVRSYQVEKIIKALESMGAEHKAGKS